MGADEDRRRATDLIETGGELAGALTGGALGTIGGPAGVVLGAAGGVAVTRTLQRLGAEVQERVLAPRQRARAGLALGVATERFAERAARGEDVRDDGFFEKRPGGERPEADELLEGVLRRAMDAYQERKVPCIGAFFASVAHRPDISPEYAHFLLRTADDLTYRQLLVLAYFAEHPSIVAEGEKNPYAGRQGWAFPWPSGLDREIAQLSQDMRLIEVRYEGPATAPSEPIRDSALGRRDVWGLTPTALGSDLYELMELAMIPAKDKRETAALFAPPEQTS